MGKCETGCQTFTGGEILHHSDCVYSPESLSELLTSAQEKLEVATDMLEKIQSKCERSELCDCCFEMMEFACMALAKIRGE